MTPLAQFPQRFGPFVLLRQLGAGGMGSAYLAMHAESDGLLVVKRMHPELVRDPVIFKRFVHEAEVAAHVRHGHVAGLVAMGTIDNEPFLATEFVFGIQLSAMVDRIEFSQTGPVPLGAGLRLGVELAAGVAAIHNARHRDTGAPLGLIHRDVGSRNILLGYDGKLRVIDLGLGKSMLSDWQTAHQVLAGSPDYMPPEQAMGARVDVRADVYGAAVSLWELLAGRKRIREENVAQRISRAISARPEGLRQYRPEVSRSLEELLMRGMDPDPEGRLSNADQLVEGLKNELRRLKPIPTQASVTRWLESACASLLAKERRSLDEARDAGRELLGKDEAKTEIFVAVPELFKKDGAADFKVFSLGATGGQSISPADEVLVSSNRWGFLEWLDWQRLQSAPAATRGLILGALSGLLLVVVVAAAVMASKPTDDQVTAVAIPEQEQPKAPVPKLPKAPTSESPVATESPDELPPFEALDDGSAIEEKPTASNPVTQRRKVTQRRPGTVSSAEVRRRKKDLLARLRRLRRMRFEIDFQKKLTRLSTQLSKARSKRSLDSIESSLRRLENGN